MSDSLPYFKTYPGDWRKDIGAQSLSYHTKGVWFELRCIMHGASQRGRLVTPDGKALTDETIARLLGLSLHDSKKSIQELLDAGVAKRCPSSGALSCPDMVSQEELRKIRQISGMKGGNPVLVKQNTYTNPNQGDNQTREYEHVYESSLIPLKDKCTEEGKSTTTTHPPESSETKGGGGGGDLNLEIDQRAGSVSLPFEVAFWNIHCGSLPKVGDFTNSRKKHLLARKKSKFFCENYQSAVIKMAENPFMCGHGNRGWKASFDWLIASDTPIVKVIEGHYDREQRNGHHREQKSAREMQEEITAKDF